MTTIQSQNTARVSPNETKPRRSATTQDCVNLLKQRREQQLFFFVAFATETDNNVSHRGYQVVTFDRLVIDDRDQRNTRVHCASPRDQLCGSVCDSLRLHDTKEIPGRFQLFEGRCVKIRTLGRKVAYACKRTKR